MKARHSATGALTRAATILLGGLVACVGQVSVARVEHGRVEVGLPVDASAYAASLREAIAREGASVPPIGRTLGPLPPGDVLRARASAATEVDSAGGGGRCASTRTTWPWMSGAAVDEALVRGDTARARKRATCTAMSDAELSLRAWYFGNVAYAVTIVNARVAAEPSWERRAVIVGSVKLLRPRGTLGDALLAWTLSIRGDEEAAKRVSTSIGRTSPDPVFQGLLRGAASAPRIEPSTRVN